MAFCNALKKIDNILSILLKSGKNKAHNMQAVNYSTARNNLKSIMKEVCQNHDEYIVNDKDGSNVVILSLEDYSALKETAYLLSSPTNAKRLFESIESFKNGGGETQKLADI